MVTEGPPAGATHCKRCSMPHRPPNCYIIEGPNGAGKTTFATRFLPLYANCLNFINPDLLARAYSPLDHEKA
jgi:predicted ABC-type ATPase